MDDRNSYVGFILGLCEAQFKDCTSQYPALAKEFERDFSRLRSAVDAHGIRFVLDTMPAFKKHFDQCLAKQHLTPSHLLHFGSWKAGGTVPRFLRGLLLRVFDLNGRMKPAPDVHAIRLIRQLLGVARRFRIECKPKDQSNAVREFVRTDLEVRLPTLDWVGDSDLDSVGLAHISFTDICAKPDESRQGSFPWFEVSSLNYRHAELIQQVADLVCACLGHYNPHDWKFRHGPGALSDVSYGTHKYEFTNWPDRLDRIFPMADFASANYAVWKDTSLYKSTDWETRKVYPAKLCAVPKTLTTPRLIASEPRSFQWCQQNIRDFLYSRVAGSILSNFVEFNRQDRNGELALDASRNQSHGTIDLSSASDRISCWHVERLFRRSPDLLDACRATRSVFIRQDICRITPQLVKLRKYSTMGNATTFPVQSLFFLSVALGSLFYTRGLRVSEKAIAALGTKQVRVFGDDLIVPEDCAGATIDALSALGLKVNTAKTFTTGRFRESCGVDAFNGEDVTVVSVLNAPTQARPGSVSSSVDVHNNLCNKGYYHTAHYVRKTVERLKYKIRAVPHGSGLFGWWPNWIDTDPILPIRVNRDLFVREVRCHSPRVKADTLPSKDSAALLQYFTEVPKVVERSVSSLHYSRKRAKSSLRLRWVAL
jgi:hypothetical protein